MPNQYNLIPQSADRRNVSQGDILNNFTYLQTSIGRDHNFTNDPLGTNDGLHTKSTYWVQTADPATTATQIAVYSKIDAAGKIQLWFRQENNGTAVQLTAQPTTALATAVPITSGNGATWLPGGFLLQWGTSTSGVGVVFPTPFMVAPVFQPRVTVTPIGATATCTTPPCITSGPTNTGFTVLNSAGQVFNYSWHAIGQA